MTKNSPNFDIATQRGRFYVDAEMLRRQYACPGGLYDYLQVFGEDRHKFNKTFIRKAVKNGLNMPFLMYRADETYNTQVDSHFQRAANAWYKNHSWSQYPTDAEEAQFYIEAFTEAGYI